MKTIADILNKVNLLRDNTNIETREMLTYINALDCQLMQSLKSIFKDSTIALTDGVQDYDLPIGIAIDDIKAVNCNGKRLLRKKTLNDDLEGWYAQGSKISFYLSHFSDEAVIQYYERTPNHEPENIATDEDLVAPEAYRDLYVYHVLAQIASKEGDPNSYENYKNDFNICLSQCLTALQGKQLYPNLAVEG